MGSQGWDQPPLTGDPLRNDISHDTPHVLPLSPLQFSSAADDVYAIAPSRSNHLLPSNRRCRHGPVSEEQDCRKQNWLYPHRSACFLFLLCLSVLYYRY